MKKGEQIFYINGIDFDQKGLKLFCKEKLNESATPDWENDCYSFILEWLSPPSTMKVHTSGSTGKPKEIILKKKFIRASALATLNFFKLQKRDSALLCLPAKYIAGKMMIVRALVGELELYFVKPSSVPEIGIVDKIDFCAMVPSQVAGLLETKEGVGLLERISTLIVGGSFLPENLEQKIKDLSTDCWQTYGMTETITHIALRRINGADAGEWYTPLKGVVVQNDESGCLVISASYIGVNKLVTNDLAEILDGKFKILGRNDHVIISGGLKLIPEEIEKKLSGFIINDFYISSLPDEKLGSKLVLYIEDNGNLTKQIYQIWEKIEARLSGFEIPKEIIFSKSFNRTNTGKIIRK